MSNRLPNGLTQAQVDDLERSSCARYHVCVACGREAPSGFKENALGGIICVDAQDCIERANIVAAYATDD